MRCFLFIVDALSHDVVKSLIELGKVPHLKTLIESGGRLSPCLSIFPSITPAATCSIMTGTHPIRHGIEGACWLDRGNQELAYFGDDIQLALQRGLFNYVIDFGDRLNFDRLKVPTLFQQLDAIGIDSLSVNSMWFAGPHQHVRTTPLALKLGVGQLPDRVGGPKFMKLGSFVETLPDGVPEQPSPSIVNRYGFTDQISIDCLLDVARHGQFPPMTVGYFPENDDIGHQEGLRDAADVALVRFDQFLGQFVEVLGGWDTVGTDNRILIVGDHSQIEFGDDGPNVLRLDEWLQSFDQASVATGWTKPQQLFICPNMRAAAIYLRDASDLEFRSRVIDRLLESTQIAIVAYEESGTVEADPFVCVQDPFGRSFRFRRADPNSANWSDDFGNHWYLDGDPLCLGLVGDEKGGFRETDFANPLERLASAFVKGSNPIWISAQTDTEFACDGQSTHPGGSHGSLHRIDSTAALVTSGGIDWSVIPNADRPRIIDVSSLCQAMFES
ncbi:MAG: alkaline phosphatase family protein [Planctomycetota bacterium]